MHRVLARASGVFFPFQVGVCPRGRGAARALVLRLALNVARNHR
jgi:hypothetical protein